MSNNNCFFNQEFQLFIWVLQTCVPFACQHQNELPVNWLSSELLPQVGQELCLPVLPAACEPAAAPVSLPEQIPYWKQV